MTVKRCWVDTAEQRADCTAIKEFKIELHLLILYFRASGMLGVVGSSRRCVAKAPQLTSEKSGGS